LLTKAPMRTRLLAALAFLFCAPLAARAEKVLHVNAEVVRQRASSGVHDAGSEQVAAWLQGRGATVARVGVGDLSSRAKTRLPLGALGRPDLVTISATMTQSRTTVTWIVKGLKAQGIPGSRIVVGGRAMSLERADKLGVQYAPGPGPQLELLLRGSTSATKRR
jgi:methanogenic corrinoid protein MtbC1